MRIIKRLLWLFRLMYREVVNGELTLLFITLTLTATAVSSVSFFSDRLNKALNLQASELLAADLVIRNTQPLPESLKKAAVEHHLNIAQSVSFPSMIVLNQQTRLVHYKAVSHNYPLRGEVTVKTADGTFYTGAFTPKAGQVWIDSRLADAFNLQAGQSLKVGNSTLLISAELVREPDSATDLLRFAPRVVMSMEDLPATGLMQEGSRATWRLLFSGSPNAIQPFRAWLQKNRPKGAHLESVEEARPEIRENLQRARRLMNFTALLTITLSAAAILLLVRCYLSRHWQAVAVLRSIGATAREIVVGLLVLLSLLALSTGIVGSLLGWGVQTILLTLAQHYIHSDFPLPDSTTWFTGVATTLLLIFTLALPPLLSLRRVQPMAILRQEMTTTLFYRTRLALLTPLTFAITSMTILVGVALWYLQDQKLVFVSLAGFTLFFVTVGVFGQLGLRLIYSSIKHLASHWVFGLRNLTRRLWLSTLQIGALAIGLMTLITFAIIWQDVIGTWKASLPKKAPNHFIINIQPQQLDALRQAFAQAHLSEPHFFPSARARLVAINDKVIQPGQFATERANRLLKHEFNLSWMQSLPPNNRVSSGRWWKDRYAPPQFSLEQGLAETLGIRLNDIVTFDIGGEIYRAPVTSLRTLQWNSMQANFFVIGTPEHFLHQPGNWLTSVWLDPVNNKPFIRHLAQDFPNLTIIDIEYIIREVKIVIGQIALGLEVLLSLALLMGLAVLWASLHSTQDERRQTISIMRALGASQRQIRQMILMELLVLGFFSGLFAALGAMGIGAGLSSYLFNQPFSVNYWVLPLGIFAGVIIVTSAGWPMVSKACRTPPMLSLRGN